MRVLLSSQGRCRRLAVIGGFIEAGRNRWQVGQRLVLARPGLAGEKAAQVGFDWDTPQDALPKVHEEADEVLTELQNARDPGEELGDLLFSCVNVARLSGIDPEQALKNATEKFIKRFSAMENLIKLDEKSLKDLTLSEMDVYWNRVKAAQNRAVEPSSPADWKR